jgi:TonB family protein
MTKNFYLFYFLYFLSINSFIYSQQDSLDCQKLRDSLNVESGFDREYWGWQFPDLIGGIEGLQKRLKYPEEAIKNNIEGKVYVNIIIDSLGKPLCPKIVRKHLGYGCEEEAIRLVMESNFTPALMKNRRRTLQIIVPIVFSLKR